MVDVVLINPPYRSVVSKYVGYAPPLGLAYIASVLEKRDVDVKIIDAPALGAEFKEIVDFVERKKPLIVGVTCTTPSYYSALKVLRGVKEVDEDIITVIGGPHVSFTAEEALMECPQVDYVVIGEGEATFLDLYERVLAGESTRDMLGIAYRDGKDVVITPPRPLIKNLDLLPFPAWHLLPMERYKAFGVREFPMITSRGCPYRCIFCVSSLLMGKRYRARSAKNVVDEMEILRTKYGIRNIGVLDDMFMLDRRRARQIALEIIERGLDIYWGASSRVDAIDYETLKTLNKAGCTTIYVGVESGDSRVLRWYRKGITPTQAMKAIRTAKRAGMGILASFILGAPVETVRSIWKTIKFAIKLSPDYAQFTILTPFPGTWLYNYAVSHGLLLTRDWTKYDTQTPVMRLPYISPKKLKELLVKAYLYFYLRGSYLKERIIQHQIPLILEVLKGGVTSVARLVLSKLRFVSFGPYS